MEIHCPSCRASIPLDDVNPSTDVALCRRCSATHSFAMLSESTAVDLRNSPPGTRFEITPGGFTAEATTRSWMTLFLIPFACVWVGGSVGSIYGRQLVNARFDAGQSFMGLPFLLGSIVLIGWCVMLSAGVARVTRQGNDLEIFTGVGLIGWRRHYRWSDFDTVREELTVGSRHRTRSIVLEGSTRAVFGSMLTEERRYFLLNVMRKMLTTR